MTYLPYSLSFSTRDEKSESPDSRMNVPISGRVNTSSRASTARRMSVAFFLFDPYAGAQIMSIEDSASGTMCCRAAGRGRWAPRARIHRGRPGVHDRHRLTPGVRVDHKERTD